VGTPCTGVRGPLLGADRLAGATSFHFDLVEAYAAGLVDNTNMFVLGKPGNGKSALVKSMIWRSLGVYGSDRFYAIVDVKGEYRALAEAAGFAVLALRPGGATAVNPLGRAGRPDVAGDTERVARHRVQLVAALCATQLGQPLTPDHDALLHAVMADIARLEADHPDHPVGLATVADLLAHPTPGMVDAVYGTDSDAIQGQVRPLLLALDGLLNRSMRGMFDGERPVELGSSTATGLVVDLSGISGDDAALPLVMVAVTAWLRELLRADWGTIRKVQILDEAWLVMRDPAIVRYLQDTWKLGRSAGFANIAILHRPSDLAAQTDAGSAAGAMATGLLTDTDTVVSYAQNADELAVHGDLLGWSAGERAVIARLERGESLWAIGERHRSLPTHLLNPGTETGLCDTDTRLLAPAGARRDGPVRP
jgi:type IV secretory pathway VirB4 component